MTGHGSPHGRWLRAGAPQLAASGDPRRARTRLLELAERPVPTRAVANLATRDAVLSWVEEIGAPIARRDTAPGHLTASAVVVDAEGQRCVLLKHTKLRRWLQPGGHADGDHELAGVALREAAEETGIRDLAVLVPAIAVDVHDVDHGDRLGAHRHLDVRFVVAAPRGAVLRGNHESSELRWVTPAECLELSGDDALTQLLHLGLEVASQVPPPPSAPLG